MFYHELHDRMVNKPVVYKSIHQIFSEWQQLEDDIVASYEEGNITQEQYEHLMIEGGFLYSHEVR